MRRLVFSPDAKGDLLDIAAYIAGDNPERAYSFVAELEAQCARLLDFPMRGQLRPELAAQLRSIPCGRYIIFFTPASDTLPVERILHGARDIGTTFANEE